MERAFADLERLLSEQEFDTLAEANEYSQKMDDYDEDVAAAFLYTRDPRPVETPPRGRQRRGESGTAIGETGRT